LFEVTYLKNYRALEFWLTLLLLLVDVIASVAAYIFWYRLAFFVGSYLFIHWLGIIATTFIAVSIPIHYIIKRKRPKYFKRILKVHTVGNLVAFLLISTHFAQNTARLAGAPERLGIGFALYLFLSLIVATGIVERYQKNGKLLRYIKFTHKYTVPILYLIILIHFLSGFNIL
jgi:hypothetical protein